MAKVLTIEDDAAVAEEILTTLGSHGFATEWVDNGRDGMVRAMTGGYDAITLDRLLPGVDGLTIVATLRSLGIETPVLMLSALGDVDERVRGLRAGGDDYLTKPFDVEEMAARLHVLLRRQSEIDAEPSRTLSVDTLELDLAARTARRAGVAIDLLPTEYRLLEFLMRNAGQLVTRGMVFEAVWGYHFDPGSNLIDVHLGRLRRKIDVPDARPLIRTVRGSGYILE
ncbi:response regulator transcription factor [Pararobbsia silviterrae]|uniref:DNA-binding response regulator n=1 Tax=Pararobbsia silviterrae TaxID=1792498 RepID=A0A494XMN3_9BURK|nr:response regulator transcription factor [Pararobbsia silviterrae]RKP51947.1 DNA-binding response regulator [Pararobbsia silviterrae]